MPSHQKLADWYHQLANQLEAGIPLAEAIRFSGGPNAQDRNRIADQIESGDAIKAVLSNAPRWLPQPDRVFIEAAMETGHAPQTFARLAARHESIQRNLLKVALGLIYPLAIFHLAAIILPIVGMIDYEVGFTWDKTQHVLGTAALILPLWTLIGLIVFMAKTENPLLPRILRMFPFLRAYSKCQALADLGDTLGTFIAAGVPAPRAWRSARELVNDPKVKQAIQGLESVFSIGADPSNKLTEYSCFPPDFCSFYRSGAQSGQLDTMMLKSAQQYQARANQAMTFAAIVYPSLVFAAVGVMLIINIFSIYGGYLDMLEKFAN